MDTLCRVTLSTLLCCSLAQKAAAQETGSHAVFRKFSDLKWEKTPDGVQDIVILHVNPIRKLRSSSFGHRKTSMCRGTGILRMRHSL